MSGGAIWLTLLGMGLVTQMIKLVLLIPKNPPTLPLRLQVALRVAPACALLSLIALDAARINGALALDWHNPKLWAVLSALLFFHYTRKPMLTIVLGMVVLLGARLLLAG
ncbi:AzlD domain-containing protein [Parvibium lacunae]|uniref:AzlD domain-containing protein n=1 Tax=Parvibium lacunae TaxID=1888893 RepID=A0A368KZJ7_9BURK|nr:AzlD domain-containing protein [Parvibium lacunae]RCS56737.1 AzlD domain-containing protein [Parvibium lacunae]